MTARGARPATPIGQADILRSVAGAATVLDAGCGSGRLTVALAQAGAVVTGIDMSSAQLERARGRAQGASVELRLLEADLDGSLPFADASFGAVTSRLALMAAANPVATLRELARVLEPSGRIATVVWAPVRANPWFGVPRDVVAAVLGPERAAFARAFGRLGEPEEAGDVHRLAGLREVRSTQIVEHLDVADAGRHWNGLVRDNGHFRRVDAAIGDAERAAVIDELAWRLAPYEVAGGLRLPRVVVLVTARAPRGPGPDPA